MMYAWILLVLLGMTEISSATEVSKFCELLFNGTQSQMLQFLSERGFALPKKPDLEGAIRNRIHSPRFRKDFWDPSPAAIYLSGVPSSIHRDASILGAHTAFLSVPRSFARGPYAWLPTPNDGFAPYKVMALSVPGLSATPAARSELGFEGFSLSLMLEDRMAWHSPWTFSMIWSQDLTVHHANRPGATRFETVDRIIKYNVFLREKKGDIVRTGLVLYTLEPTSMTLIKSQNVSGMPHVVEREQNTGLVRSWTEFLPELLENELGEEMLTIRWNSRKVETSTSSGAVAIKL